jgi:hypothetical protein
MVVHGKLLSLVRPAPRRMATGSSFVRLEPAHQLGTSLTLYVLTDPPSTCNDSLTDDNTGNVRGRVLLYFPVYVLAWRDKHRCWLVNGVH